MPTTRRVVLLFLTALATPAGAAVTPENVARLAPTWHFALPTKAVTGALVLHDGVVYAPAWDGNVYALDARTGVPRWTFTAGGPFGVIGGVLPVGDGRLCFASSEPKAYCIDAGDGSLVWSQAIGTPGLDAVWSQVAVGNGRLFAGIASLADNPCTKGRLVALDLASGALLWSRQTVPDRICETDTDVPCTTDADCGGSACVDARGAGVTGAVALDPTGRFVYMNTVGCYTFPSVGDSDTIFKLDAATGAEVWKYRASPPEQFGYCAADGAVDCGRDADCAGVGGPCTIPKPNYHDFGFLNGPLRLVVPHGGGTRTLIVSGSKNGTLYAIDDASGLPAWTREVQPPPVTPGFAGFGLFNGAVAHADGRLHAALNRLIPARVCAVDRRTGCNGDADCPSGTCLPAPEHLAAFDAATGTPLWSAEIGPSWSSVAVANGVVYAGTNTEDPATDASEFYAHDAATGARLATFAVPARSTARAAVGDDSLFVGYGAFGKGGVRAFSLCGNGEIDPGEGCDPAAPGTSCCSPGCAVLAAGSACDDGDACTSGDACGAGGCAGGTVTVGDLGCVLAGIGAAPCAEALPTRLARAIRRHLDAGTALLENAARHAARGRTAKVETVRRAVLARVAAVGRLAVKAGRSRQPKRRITPDCRAAIEALAGRARGLVEAFRFPPPG